MLNYKRFVVLLTFVCLFATALVMHLLGGIEPEQLQSWLRQAGIWAPVIYIIFYVVATVLILPSTALNLTGGAIFGPWLGTLWTSVAAVIAAVVSFAYTRTVGRKLVV
ncbi:MAG: TVP38/TMEM64 family protein, partial [Moorea sp. SIO2C4]|nr:TVP38/TMEM64 family protein [Moorena sp. SIO2C4]